MTRLAPTMAASSSSRGRPIQNRPTIAFATPAGSCSMNPQTTVRWDGGGGDEALSGPSDEYEQRSLTFTVSEDVDLVTLVAGYDAEGGDAVLQFDDLALAQEG